MARALTALALALLLVPAAAHADAPHQDETAPPPLSDRPTSGTISLYSGRTLGVGRNALAAGAGWPGVYAEALLAPTSTFDIGLRATFLWATPLIGFGAGFGAHVEIPARLHLYGTGTMDIALAARLGGLVGEARLVGQEGSFSTALGWGLHLDAGVLAGFELSEGFTFTMGLMLGGGAVDTPSANAGAGIGMATAIAGIEVSVSEDIELFVNVEGGGGFNTGGDKLFSTNAILRANAGIAITP